MNSVISETSVQSRRPPTIDPLPPVAKLGARVRRLSANFWLEFLFFWTEHYPPAVRATRGFFLWFAWNFSRVLHDGTTANARRILGAEASPKQVERLARAMIDNFYWTVFELGRNLRLTCEQLRNQVESIDGSSNYHQVRAAQHGAIIVTAHLGSFEAGTAALLSHEREIHVLFQRDAYPRFERLRTRLRRRLGVHEAPLDDGWPVWMQLRDALLRNAVVMIQGDRVMPGQRGIRVPFMNGHIRVPSGPVKLALVTQAPIIPVFSVRTAIGRLRIIVDNPIHVSRGDGPPHEGHPAIRAIASAIERQVRAYPEQWLMMYPVWCEDEDDVPRPM